MLKPDTIYYVWMPYRNAPDNKSGEPVGDIVLAPEKPNEIDGPHWAKIGRLLTNDVGNIRFFEHPG